MELAALDDGARSAAQVDRVAIDMLEPGVIVALGEQKEEPLRLHAPALVEKLAHSARAQAVQPLEQHVEGVEAFPAGQLVQCFEDRAFGRGGGQRPAPGRAAACAERLEIDGVHAKGRVREQPPAAHDDGRVEIEPGQPGRGSPYR